ncbi:DUF975 family protein [Lactobacillus apis]|uniref:DUF975 family protein n=1 Tax=Lactobacillus apis TaxID=303541 RepID=UPI0027417737|nr:DUF975 family protein [Lactobacillus apis]WLS84888.1 DUF975 family protein [Lactobacillus apis]
MTRAELKTGAKNQLRHNWGWAVLVTLIFTVVYTVFLVPSVNRSLQTTNGVNDVMKGASIVSILAPNGWARAFGEDVLGILSGFFFVSFPLVFLHFTHGRFIPEFLNYFLSSIFQWLWSFLLIIPGIVKAYSYALTPYIVNDMVASGKEVHATTAITASRQLMKGHKWELFVLDLSFIPWYLLGIITLGIGYLWLVPYISTTKANFYRNLAGDQFSN